MDNLKSAIEALLFAAGDAVPASRMALVLDVSEEEIHSSAQSLMDEFESNERGMRIIKLESKYQMCSAPEYAVLISRCMEQRKPPMLSQAALETLAVTAYFQPVTRAYIDQIRGVDSSYTVSVLQERGLIEICGRLEVPGRPALFRTTDVFLRTMGVSSLTELPVLPEVSASEGIDKLQAAINKLQNANSESQQSI